MFEKDLRDLQAWLDATPARLKSRPQATDADLASFAFRARLVRMQGFAVPEAELRQQWEARPDGGSRQAPRLLRCSRRNHCW